jgi:DNA polymerase-1
VAMAYLKRAYDHGYAGTDVHTYGGRLIRMPPMPRDLDETGERSWLGGRARFARNAVIQGAAAELFKAWAVTVRNRIVSLDAQIVMCLHDELLIHVPDEHGEAVGALLHSCLDEASRRWTAQAPVRFVADVGIISRWSEAKH